MIKFYQLLIGIITLDRLDFSGNLNRLKEVVSSYPQIEQKKLKLSIMTLKLSSTLKFLPQLARLTILVIWAGSHVDDSISYPLEFVMDNVVGTAHILDYVRKIDGLEDLHILALMKFLARSCWSIL